MRGHGQVRLWRCYELGVRIFSTCTQFGSIRMTSSQFLVRVLNTARDTEQQIFVCNLLLFYPGSPATCPAVRGSLFA